MFQSAGYPATSEVMDPATSEIMDPVDFGPGVSGSAGEYYGRWNSGGGDGSKYRYGLSSSGSTPILDHTLLRINARSAYHDSMQGRAIIDRFADLVPGAGLKLEATPDPKALGITDEQAETWAQDVEARFDVYMRSKDFSLAGDITGYQSQRFVTTQQMRDGEYFAQLHRTRRQGRNPLQISFWDPAQIQGCPQTDTAGHWLPDSGIQYNSAGQEVAYNVLTYDPKSYEYKAEVVRRVGPRSGKVFVLHGFQKEYPAQRRGYPRISHILHELEKLTDFELSHIEKAIHESMIAVYVKPNSKHPASAAGLEDLAHSPAGPWKAPDQPVTSTDTITQPYADYSEVNEVSARPGAWFNAGLQGGEDLKTLPLSTPADNYHTFVDAFMKSLCASVSMPYELVWMRFGESFSASRASLVLAWQAIEIWRHEMASDYLEPIYEAWLEGEIAAGRVRAPGWADPRSRRAWLSSNWIGFPMPNIDPSKTAKADEMYVNMGATTLDKVARQLNGSSGKANRRKLAREFEELPASPFMKTAGAATAEAEGSTEDEKQTKRGPGRPVGS